MRCLTAVAPQASPTVLCALSSSQSPWCTPVFTKCARHASSSALPRCATCIMYILLGGVTCIMYILFGSVTCIMYILLGGVTCITYILLGGVTHSKYSKKL